MEYRSTEESKNERSTTPEYRTVRESLGFRVDSLPRDSYTS
jgi:hypothetical protein